MKDKPAYETGVQKLQTLKGPDPRDEFSQKAAENQKPPLGMGLAEKIDERSEADKSDLRDSARGQPENDAAGQSETRHAGGHNDGTTSASPRVLSGDDSGDATFPLKPPR